MSNDDGDNVVRLPYGGTADPNSGFAAGSDTSEERARNEATRGVTGRRQRLVMSILADAQRTGLTWRELASMTSMHHGQASSVLSGLHKARQVMRLAERRDRCSVYVLPQFVAERETQLPGSTAVNQLVQDLADTLRRTRPEHTDGDCLHCEVSQLLMRADAHYWGRSSG